MTEKVEGEDTKTAEQAINLEAGAGRAVMQEMADLMPPPVHPADPADVASDALDAVVDIIAQARPMTDSEDYDEIMAAEMAWERAVLLELAQRLVVACGITLDELRLGGGPMSEDPVFEITDPDEPCDCGCGMAEDDR